MNTTEMAALLGRPLTTIETTNFSLYLKIAKQNLDELLCMELCSEEQTKVFDAREGYSTVFTDVFTDIEEVKVNDVVIDTDKYSRRQWDRRTGSWYNSLVFTYKLDLNDEVSVTADWGFSSYPSDIKYMLAGLFGLISKKNKFDGTISSKQVEDFRISFRADADLDDEFYKTYQRTISKYSICDMAYIRHGKVCDYCSLSRCMC